MNSLEVPSTKPRRSAFRRVAGRATLILGALFLIALPGGESGLALVPRGLPGPRAFSTLPAGWPAPSPAVASDAEARVWSLVWNSCERYGISDQALAMYGVLWEESRCKAGVRSPCGRYFGIGQFAPSTFRQNVQEMERRGLIPRDSGFSPFNDEQAIQVMAFMWSEGYERHWGPYQRVAKRVARRLPNVPPPGTTVDLALSR